MEIFKVVSLRFLLHNLCASQKSEKIVLCLDSRWNVEYALLTVEWWYVLSVLRLLHVSSSFVFAYLPLIGKNATSSFALGYLR